jgi:NhaA family Na+:H+ antiporter
MGASAPANAAWWQRDTTPGFLLIGAAIVSFVLSNSAIADSWKTFLAVPLKAEVFGYAYDSYVKGFVKDGLMALFFFYVGLELKRECIEGPFRNPREAALPALGAVGGMAAPALIYLLIATHLHPQASADYMRGWAIPCATDIAFAVGVLSLLGSRVPLGLRLFLLALAIADDLGAILVIAIFYSEAPNIMALTVCAGLLIGGLALNRLGVKQLWPYFMLFAAMWLAFAKSGVSPTLAGVLAALTIPMTAPNGRKPLVDVEHALKPYVQLGVMPLFAVVMAGVPLAGLGLETLLHPVTLGIALGLVVGKPLGIVTLAWLGSKVLRQPLPSRLTSLLGAAFVAGIGFTMSLFVGALAFYGDAAMEAPIRIGVLGGSVIAAIFGLLILHLSLPKHRQAPSDAALAAQESIAVDEGLLDKR